MKKSEVCIYGVYNHDLVMQVDHLPHIGETIQSQRLQHFHGGKGSNQALAAHALGANVTFLTTLGEDEVATSVLQYYQSLGLHTQYIKQMPGSTGTALILRTPSDNSIVIAPKSACQLDEFQDYESILKQSDIFVTQLEVGTQQAFNALAQAKAFDISTLLDPTPIQVPLDEKWYKYIDWITPNQTEAEILLGYPVQTLDDAKRAADELLNLGCTHVLLTMGPLGVLYKNKNYMIFIPAMVMPVQDTTGAGDTFNGAFVSQYWRKTSNPENMHQHVTDALNFAVVASGLCITKEGAAASIPTLQDVEKYITNQGNNL